MFDKLKNLFKTPIIEPTTETEKVEPAAPKQKKPKKPRTKKNTEPTLTPNFVDIIKSRI